MLVYLNDGTLKVFYNCRYKGEDIPDELRKLYDYVENGNAGDELTKRIDEAVAKGRTNAVWRTQYMKEWVLLMDARDEGREEESTERITDMLTRGKTVDEIVEFCGYSRDLVKKVHDSIMTAVNS